MIITVKKILRLINACESQEQIDSCRIVVQTYIKSLNSSGLENIEDLKKRLDDELSQKQEALMLSRMFNDKIP